MMATLVADIARTLERYVSETTVLLHARRDRRPSGPCRGRRGSAASGTVGPAGLDRRESPCYQVGQRPQGVTVASSCDLPTITMP